MDESEITLGEKYRDNVTGIQGTAISTHEYLHGCTRVTLQWLNNGEIKDYTFDSPSLVSVETDAPVTSPRTGGPRPTPSARAGE